MTMQKRGVDLYKHIAGKNKKTSRETSKTSPQEPPAAPAREREAPLPLKGKKTKAPPSAPKKKKAPFSPPPPGGFLKIAQKKGGLGKAARFLLLLDKDEAARVMGRLSPQEAETLAREIAGVQRVDAGEAQDVLEEFGIRLEEETLRVQGGVTAAREILQGAFGPEKAEKILIKAVPDAQPKPFAFIGDLDFTQAAAFLRKENPETLAVVLAYLAPRQASQILESLPPQERTAVALRMGRGRAISREVLQTMEKTFQEKIKFIGKSDSEDLDGRAALAGILRCMDLSDEKRLLEELAAVDKETAWGVREKLFTMDTVHHLRVKDLEDALAHTEDQEIALFLKGQDPEVKKRVLGGLSQRRRQLVEDEYDILGGVKRKEADKAARDFLERLREKEESGEYVIFREEEDLLS